VPDVRDVTGDRLHYRALVSRVREIVSRVVPADASVLAISRGDTRLLDIAGRRVSHFPQNEHGVYAGFHPADSTAAITHLESLRGRGAEYLLVPEPAFWWFQHYKQFRRHLDARYEVVAREDDTCVVYSLTPRAASSDGSAAPATEEARSYRALVLQVREVVEALLPAAATVVVITAGDEALLSLGGRRGWHYPQNDRGVYAGFYPADSHTAFAHLEELRAKGAEYLVIPRTAFWWLTYYREFADELAARCRLVTRQPNVCMIYALKQRPAR
jgi:hypothetical protein